MDNLIRSVDDCIRSNDFTTLLAIFSPHGGRWQSLGGGEQRTLAAHFVKAVVKEEQQQQQQQQQQSPPPPSSKPTFFPAAFESNEAMLAMTRALTHLPAGPIENAADNTLRKMLFKYKVHEEEDYSGAAKILASLRMEDDPGSVYFANPAEKCDVYVQIAECFLEEDETVEADSAVTKAGSVVEDITNPEEHRPLILRYKSTYARVLDANRKFLQAASRYHDLSQAVDDVDADDLLVMLGRAATCAILAQPGPQRQRILGLVYKDPRLSQLEPIPEFQTHPSVLQKMYMNRILQPTEIKTFESSLAEHQRAVMGDGLTIVERAVIEHNILAVGKLYYNIYFTDLGRLLGVDRVKAERVAAGMIVDGRLMMKGASIDQVDGVLSFGEEEEVELLRWDETIMAMCVQLNKVADRVMEKEEEEEM